MAALYARCTVVRDHLLYRFFFIIQHKVINKIKFGVKTSLYIGFAYLRNWCLCRNSDLFFHGRFKYSYLYNSICYL